MKREAGNRAKSYKTGRRKTEPRLGENKRKEGKRFAVYTKEESRSAFAEKKEEFTCKIPKTSLKRLYFQGILAFRNHFSKVGQMHHNGCKEKIKSRRPSPFSLQLAWSTSGG